jgi:hypothetical protein
LRFKDAQVSTIFTCEDIRAGSPMFAPAIQRLALLALLARGATCGEHRTIWMVNVIESVYMVIY